MDLRVMKYLVKMYITDYESTNIMQSVENESS